MNGFALGFVFVALQALGGVSILVQRDGMDRCASASGQQSEKTGTNPKGSSDPAASGRNGRISEQNAIGEQGHSGTGECVEHDGRREAIGACKRLIDNRFL